MEKDLPSASDESDEDFVPGQHSSDENSNSSASEDDCSEDESVSKISKKRKLMKKEKESEENEKDSEKTVAEVEALWKDFKEDVSKMEKQIKSNAEKVEDKPVTEMKTEKVVGCESNSSEKRESQPLKRGFPSKVNSGGKLGLSKILNQIGKKDKMSTLAKSQLDWNNFKKSEGIEEEIKLHNRGKDGYLDKQDFLQRTDLRQFEIEKQLRANSRRKF